MRKFKAFAILLGIATAGLTISPSANAIPIIYDLAADWSDVSNPNGVWTYELNNLTAGSSTRTGDIFGTPPPIWGSEHKGWSQSNGSEAFTTSTPDWTAGDVFGHTPDLLETMAIAWTSPDDGLVDITGGIWAGRDIGRSNVWELTKNGFQLTSGAIASGDIYDSSNPFDFLTGSGGNSAITGINVSPGNVLRLTIGPDNIVGDGAGDYVVVDLTITQSSNVPEPSTLALFGIGLLGLGMRRRRRAA